MKKFTLIFAAILFVVLALNTAAMRGLMSWFNTPVTTKAEIAGKDGALTVTAPNTIVNKYAVLAVDAPVGATLIAVNNPGGSAGLDPATLTAGDLLLVIQMAGASINNSDSPSYGQVTDFKNAGHHEFVTVNAVINGNMIVINPPCSGLRFAYTAAGKAQVIRVPQYTSLTIDSGGSLTAPAWNGRIGGIVAVHVQNNAIINGAIDVSSLGFRGGALSPAGGGGFRNDYVTLQQDFGAEKGEGIAGYQMEYDIFGGRYGRGAAANAGGGGTSHNSGGGGGANGNNGNAYTGQGIMDPNPSYLAAWALDPSYIANGNALTNSSGGGRGGYSYSVNEQNAMTTAPGDASWGGDFRRQVGGLGGHPLNQDTSGRIFFGGGGGAGAQNNDAGGGGGAGGGLIYIIADSVSGSGQLRANGANGGNTRNENRDGAGGAGAGGTIVVAAKTLSGISGIADGGNGGNQSTPFQTTFPNEAEGPGGGGGGGFIAYSGGSMTTSVKGGVNGTTLATSQTEFLPNGATRGASGTTSNATINVPFCSTYADLSITKTNNTTTIVPGAPTTYTIVAQNNGPNAVFSIPVIDTPPPIFSNISWTCTASSGSRCLISMGTGAINTKVDLLVGGTATFQLTATADPSATGTVTNTARIIIPDGAVDTNPNNNTASDTDTFTPQADLSILKTADSATVLPGSQITYRIAATNNGPSAVTGANVRDMLPITLSNASWTCTATAGSSCVPSNGTGNINSTVNLLVGGVANFTLTATLASDATGTLTNTATITPPSGVSDPNNANNTSTVNTPITSRSDLQIVKTASQNPIPAGSELTYSLVVTNLGPAPATNVKVTDALNSDLVFISATATQGSCTGTTNITCNLGTLGASPPANQATVTIRVRIPANFDVGPLPNTAVVESTTQDPNPGNNTSMTTVNVTPPPGANFNPADIKVTNTTTDVCIDGSTTINVEIDLTNSGNGIQKDNPGPELLGNFPVELSGITASCSSTSGSCRISSSQIEWNGQIDPGQTVKIFYSARVRQSIEVGARFCTNYRVNYDTNSDEINDAVTTFTSCLRANCTPPPCSGPDCPDDTIGTPYPLGPNSLASDQRPGSILIFPYFSSDATAPMAQNTRISISNTDKFRPAYMHMFFVDGSTCTIADSFLCLTPDQTISFLASDFDPGISGYLIVVAVDSEGCPTNFNKLIGDEYIKLATGHFASLGATAVPAIDPPSCNPALGQATINFNGIEYSQLGRSLIMDNVSSPLDGNSTLLVLDSIGGNLLDGSTTLGVIFGLAYDDKEIGHSFSLNPGVCQLRQIFTGTNPRLSPRLTEIIPSGHSGWFRLTLQQDRVMVGVMLNTTPNPNGYNGGHNLHIQTLGNTSLTIPLLSPPCQ